jgi:molybdate transport system substrate-binding protein
MMARPIAALTNALVALLSLVAFAAAAAEITVLSSAAFLPVLNDLGPKFERESGHLLRIHSDSGAALTRRIQAGEPFDVAIISPEPIDALIKQDKIAAQSRADIGRTGVGVAVRAGAPKPDVSSLDGFRNALLNARSVSYVGEGGGGKHFLAVLDRLGIMEQMKPRLRPMPGGGAIKPVVTGETELAVNLIPPILEERGVTFAGPLPPELQSYIGYTAGISRASTQAGAARALIDFLIGPSARPVLTARGMEPARQDR